MRILERVLHDGWGTAVSYLWLLMGAAFACDGSTGVAAAPNIDAGIGTGGPVEAVDQPGPCPVSISEIAVYQTVKIPLVIEGQPVNVRNAEVIEGKLGLVRALVRPETDAAATGVVARLTLHRAEVKKVFEDKKTFLEPSREDSHEGAFEFALQAEDVTADAVISVEVIGFQGCRAGQVDAGTADVPLLARRANALNLLLLPLVYSPDGSNRLPDVSEVQIQRFRELLLAMYPVTGVDVSVGEPLLTDVTLTASRGWTRLLDNLRGWRLAQSIPDDTYVYALVVPSMDFSSYCRRGCIEGIAYQAGVNQGSLRVGVGIGYLGGESADTLAHELGHQHGLAHAPCMTTAGVDSEFPYKGGRAGVWGYDARTGGFLDPQNTFDLMGYCRPAWISDHHYRALLESRLPRTAAASRESATERDALVLVAADDDVPFWSHWDAGDSSHASGTIVRARVVNQLGEQVASVNVAAIPFADVKGATYLVPRPNPQWHAIEIPGLPNIVFPAAR